MEYKFLAIISANIIYFALKLGLNHGKENFETLQGFKSAINKSK